MLSQDTVFCLLLYTLLVSGCESFLHSGMVFLITSKYAASQQVAFRNEVCVQVHHAAHATCALRFWPRVTRSFARFTRNDILHPIIAGHFVSGRCCELNIFQRFIPMTYTLPRLGFCALSKLTCGTCGAVGCMIVERAQYQWRKRTIAMQRHNSNAK
jgi:hypothetical protein